MSMYNTSWIAGTPRTGSMLTFNLTREIFGINSKNIKPQHVPQEDEDMFACYTNEAMNDTNSLNKYVFKVHQTLRLDLPKSKYIVNVRNPFDICASFYEFMKCDFRHAMRAAKTHLNTIQHYQACPKDRNFVHVQPIVCNMSAYVSPRYLFSLLVGDVGPNTEI